MQGFNMGRYVPPDLEGTTSANKLHKKHGLGQRASKLASHGILTVRFEMPFPIWCTSCPKPTIIAQGVRFNAEKKKAGAYYSSPIWSFRFRHAACGGTIEMRTDPKNTAYVVVEGATKRDTGEDKGPREGDEALAIMTDQEREALRKNAFASLEKTIEDRERLKAATQRIDGLLDAQAKFWDDPYAQNQKLRRAFRAGRKEREREAERAEDLKDRMSLGIDLVPATEHDATRAALVDFGPGEDARAAQRALARPLFQTAGGDGNGTGDRDAARNKSGFVADIMNNTRWAKDPFLQKKDGVKAARIQGVKRKRTDDEDRNPSPDKDARSASALVEYDSD
ncbi:Coiled-coil domain-containing protein [Metarhizium anisopliae]|nr:Coiled-coil domain-containing protein [Metarhizium anisopliae]